MNLVLIGLMASGKTTVGRLLAKALGRPFVDADLEVEARTGRSIPDIFATDGEAVFRDLEAEAIADLCRRDGLVIATGGGAVLRPANREALRRSGLVFWLDLPPAELYRRAGRQGLAGRPLLRDDDPLGRLEALARSRAEAYATTAHHRVDAAGLSPQAVADQILLILNADKGDHENATGSGQPG
jgi:shikimate kinase